MWLLSLESKKIMTRIVITVTLLRPAVWPHAAMLGVEQLAGVVVWSCLMVLNWLKAQFLYPLANWWLDSVLGTWEESTKSLLREFSAQTVRILDFCFNALFSWFPGFQSTKTTRERPSAWQSWWAENRQSTFNAIIEDRDTAANRGANFLSSQPKHEGIFHRHTSFCLVYVGIMPAFSWVSATLQVTTRKPSTIQSLLRTSSARGLGGYWSTGGLDADSGKA